MSQPFKLNKLTDCKWVNMFEVAYTTKAKLKGLWLMCSRKARPITDAHKADAVVIVPVVNTAEGKKLVITKEFRVPIWDYEYGFPAGLIDDDEDLTNTVTRELKEETGLDLVEIKHVSMPVYSSAGLTDESCHMIIVEAKGEISSKWLEETEDIQTLLMDAEQVAELLKSQEKIAAKAWGLLYCYARTGNID